MTLKFNTPKEEKRLRNRITISRWIIILIFLVGVMVGMMIIYKVELNTINQSFDSLEYCYTELIKLK